MIESTSDGDSDEYLAQWAEKVATSVTAEELTRLLMDYQQQANKSRRSVADREFARRRAAALESEITSQLTNNNCDVIFLSRSMNDAEREKLP